MIHYDRRPSIDRSRKTAIVVLVALLHLLVLWWLAMTRMAEPVLSSLPVFEVSLFSPSPGGGGGQPAQNADERDSAGRSTPSNLHVPEKTLPWPETLIAPSEQDAAAPTIGGALSADASGAGLDLVARETGTAAVGGAGSGSGGGIGSGTGPGVGSGMGSGRSGATPANDLSGPQLLRRPTQVQVNRSYPQYARFRGISGQAVVSCVVGVDTRLRDCRLLGETPGQLGFGEAGLKLAREYRYRPPMRNGRAMDGHVVTFAVDYVRRP